MKTSAATLDSNGNIYTGYIDEHGKPVERTKDKYPYSYDGFVIKRLGENSEVNCTAYSDRLFQWDSKKYNELSKKHFGNQSQYFSDRSAKDIEKFLRDWNDDKDLKLILIMEYCNASSGYPLWRFDVKLSK